MKKEVKEKPVKVVAKATEKKVEKASFHRIITGEVVSVSRPKTVGVQITRFIRHPIYKKSMKRNRTFAAHNESLDLKLGDVVKIQEIRPMSKTKHFTVIAKV